MSPLRHETINGYLIEEYYWAGDLVVYVNSIRHFFNYETACKLFAHANKYEPVCHCGAPVAEHSQSDNHAPVEMEPLQPHPANGSEG